MAESKSLLQPVDDATRSLARRLIRAARHAALGVIDPAANWPMVSRTALATDLDGSPIILVSALSAHTQALQLDPRCSLLLGEPGKGDPLAHARISLQAKAVRVDSSEARFERIRRRYLARLPKAALYADFADFSFWRIEPERASLNGGFGRAFELAPADLLTPVTDEAGFDEVDQQACAHMNQDHSAAVCELAHKLGKKVGESAQDWQMVTMDPHGVELAVADALIRLEFEGLAQSPQAIHQALMGLLADARKREHKA